jgi:hypothetical protein
LRPELEDNRIPVPASMQRPQPATNTASRRPAAPAPTSSALAAIAAARRNGPPSAPPARSLSSPAPLEHHPRTSLGARVGTIAGRHWRRILVAAVVVVAVTASGVVVWPVLFRSSPTSSAPTTGAAREAVATDLLRTVIGGGRALFATHHSFAAATAATLSSLSYRVPVVASTSPARSGAVSMRVDSAREITLATPADANRCVFARDEPAQSVTQFVTVSTAVCRASAAPVTGWSSR